MVKIVKWIEDLQKLCKPAIVYLVISAIGMAMLFFQNAKNYTSYCVGMYECQVPSTTAILVMQVVHTIIWTFILNAICKSTKSKTGNRIAWFFVLIPILLMAIAIALLFIRGDTPPDHVLLV